MALIAVLVLAACSDRDRPLPGERIAVRPDEVPSADAAGAYGLAIPPARLNADWSHRNGAAAGRLTNPAFRPVPQLIWSVDIGAGDSKRARLLTSPIVAGGLIYAIDADGQLTAVTRDGRVAWTRSLVPTTQVPDSGPGGGMAVAGGVLYVTTGFGEVFALSPATGGTIWQRTLEGPIRAAPVVSGGRVVAVQRDDTAVALDARSGEILWRVQGTGGTGLLGGASPAADDRLVVIPFASGEVLGVLARNGLTVWGTAVTGGRREYARNDITDISGDPVIDGGVVYASNQSGRTVRLNAETGERDWTIQEGSYGPAWPVGARCSCSPTSARWCAPMPRPASCSGWCSCRSSSRTRASSAAASRSARSPTTGRSSPAAGCGSRAPTSSCGPSTRWTAASLAEVALPGGAAAAPAIAGGVMYIPTREGRLLAFQ